MEHATKHDTLAWAERPWLELVRLSWPITISLLSFSLMTAVDTLFVGRMGSAALAGVGLAGSASFTILCFGLGVLRATKICVAHAAGAGNREAATAYLGASLWGALGLGLATSVLGQGVARLLPWLTASAESGQVATTYTALRTLGAPVVLISVALREARQALGDARSPMIATLFANLVNLALVALFSNVFAWGVPGIACATLLAQLTEALVLAHMQRAHGFGLRSFDVKDAQRLLKLGVPLGIERFLDVSSFTVVVGLFAWMGDIDLAAHQIACQVLLFAFMPSIAIGEATCVLIGQAVGADSQHSVPHVQRSALVASFVYVAACSCALLTLGPLLAASFTHEPRVIARAVELLTIGAVFVWALPAYQIGQSSLRAVGDVRAAALITVFAAWGCTPVLAALFGLGLGMGARGGWIGSGSELALGGWLFWWRLRGRGRALLYDARHDRVSTPPAVVFVP